MKLQFSYHRVCVWVCKRALFAMFKIVLGNSSILRKGIKFNGIKFQSTESKWSLFGFAGWRDLFIWGGKQVLCFRRGASDSFRQEQTQFLRTPRKDQSSQKRSSEQFAKRKTKKEKTEDILFWFSECNNKVKRRLKDFLLRFHFNSNQVTTWHDM